jgi:predicted DCC family thiol-disulfide oxidoreductase YuxK
MHEHVILFDGECPLCHRSVRYIIGIDVHKRFMFAPLGGETAKKLLTGPQEPLKRANSMVLVENYDSTHRQYWIRSKAVLRMYWLVGNGWGIIGILSFLPGWVGDFLYNAFASHRHQFKLRMPEGPGPEDRFLP